MLFTKSRRAQSVDDYETWVESEFTNTLNTFDLGDIRTTTLIIFYGNRVADIRIQGDVINTLQARMGTGGNNMPILAYSIREDAKANNFSATEIEQARALQSLQPSVQSHHAQTFIAEPMRVRRLTPTECERLQGFPDGWTDEQSDTQRYKQMGNAVTVNVIEWIGSRL
jgi:site-specific DNA-cytosine methylase